MKLKIAVLVSGRGSNLQSIIDSIEMGRLDAEIGIVISNVENAYALNRARKYNIETLFLDPEKFRTRYEYDLEIIHIIKQRQIRLVCLAGFMRILTPRFVHEFSGNIINIHPSLLPAFPGLHAQKQAIEYGIKFSGCTVHFVDEGVDTGPIILQSVVPVDESDTEETLAAKILKEEHIIYPKAIQYIARGMLILKGKRVFLR